MNIVTCKACGSAQTRKPRPCIKCGAELPVLAMEGKPVKLSGKPSDKLSDKDHISQAGKKVYDAKQRKIQAKIKPGTDDQLFTSTLKRREGCI